MARHEEIVDCAWLWGDKPPSNTAMLDNALSASSIGATKRVHAEARRPQRSIPHNVMLEPRACRAQLGSASIVQRCPTGRDEKWTLNQVQGDGNIRLRTPIPQHCHSRESGNPWPDIPARDTILVRTKTRRHGATSSCLRAFVRTILPIDVVGPSLRWGDGNIRLRTPIPQNCHSRARYVFSSHEDTKTRSNFFMPSCLCANHFADSSGHGFPLSRE